MARPINCSCAHERLMEWRLCLCSMVVLVLVPFFLAYSSGNFWLKENTYREQPRVKYMYKVRCAD